MDTRQLSSTSSSGWSPSPVCPSSDGLAEFNRKLELRRRVVESNGEVWETVASLSKADAGQRAWERIGSKEATASRAVQPLRWSVTAPASVAGDGARATEEAAEAVAARTPSPLKKKSIVLTPSTAVLSPPVEDDSLKVDQEPERTPCLDKRCGEDPVGTPYVDAEVPEEHREKERVSPRLLVFEDTFSVSAEGSLAPEVPEERAAIADLLDESERRCRILAEHSDGFWEEDVYDVINKIHAAGYNMVQTEDLSAGREEGEGATAAAANRRTPGDFLREVRGCGVRVRLNNGTDYTGRLLALDGFMNLAMDEAVEFPYGVNSGSEGRRYGQAVIRGNNVLYISMLERKEEGEEAAAAPEGEDGH
ncbi:U4/U6-U5 snRNP complex subunit lsm6 [Perkinsus chesapeaki]|uniref:U4/U6-U5 snRNP complex subunit lsm6 n=1 Tax=Perkinsus chesapeaki TaxID=330153 RepID=A0A7J6N3R3_PERCH|nr:U4/U6-U5 snRNP complex subunit lsm6 [Perkinsus chesapeaki]